MIKKATQTGGSTDLTTITTDVKPNTDNANTLGSSSKRWSNVFGTTITSAALTAAASSAMTLTANVADSGTNTAFTFNNSVALTGTTVLASFKNNSVEKFSIADDGAVVAAGGITGASLTASTLSAAASTAMTVTANVANSGTNVAFTLNNSVALTGTTKLLSLSSNSSEKFYVTQDGSLVAGASGAGKVSARTHADEQAVARIEFFQFSNQAANHYRGRCSDAADSVSHRFGNSTSLTTSGAQIAAFYSDDISTKKAFIDIGGQLENTVAGNGIILKSPDGTRYRLTIANGGTVSIAAA